VASGAGARLNPSSVSPPRIVLVEPQLGENIGAAARAMANCGLSDLMLVQPREAWPNSRARTMAAGATAVVDSARLAGDVAGAVADLHRVYATTARPREIAARVLTPRAAAAEMRAAAARGERCGVLFGRERSGLTNDDVTHAQAVITVPLNPAYTSLNLAQAVLLVGYEWYLAGDDTPAESLEVGGQSPATQDEVEALLGHLVGELDAATYFRAEHMRPTIVQNLRALLRRARPTEQEVRSLHGVVSALALGRQSRRRSKG